jgi:hypothetical protein
LNSNFCHFPLRSLFDLGLFGEGWHTRYLSTYMPTAISWPHSVGLRSSRPGVATSSLVQKNCAGSFRGAHWILCCPRRHHRQICYSKKKIGWSLEPPPYHTGAPRKRGEPELKKTCRFFPGVRTFDVYIYIGVCPTCGSIEYAASLPPAALVPCAPRVPVSRAKKYISCLRAVGESQSVSACSRLFDKRQAAALSAEAA